MRLKVEIFGEALGTFLLVFFGCGSVCTAITTGAFVGVFQIAMIWGLGIAIAIYLTGGLSGAHLNPAVTVTMAVFRRFPLHKILPYVGAQIVGAFLASAVLLLIFSNALTAFEQAQGIVRGRPGSEASAMVFGEYFPNPGGKPLTETARKVMPPGSAFITEVIGTAILLLVILGVTDERNATFPKILTAPTVGLTVTVLISLFAPLTMACFNPARDFGPRLFSVLAGWGSVPFQANGLGWLTVYIVAPVIGGLVGGACYHFGLAPCYRHFPGEKPFKS